MKLDKRLIPILALTLAGVFLFADLSSAQRRGGGGGPWCQLNQASQDTGAGSGRGQGWGRGRGRGRGNANCPNYPQYRNCPQGAGAQGQNFQGQGGSGQKAPNTPGNQGKVTQ